MRMVKASGGARRVARLMGSAACLCVSLLVPAAMAAPPDLEGVWTNSSITVLERTDPRLPLRLSEEQARAIEAARGAQDAASSAPTPESEGAPAAGGAVLGYNTFWLDRGDRVGRVQGEPRSSWITDPPDGRLPLSEEGRTRAAVIMAGRGEDGPEGMNPADRCLVASRGSGGPPMLNNIYNNTYQIVQTPDHVMILVEMNHDARIIRLNGAHRPAPLSQWLGDSVGWYEGDALIVETRNWKKAHGDYEPVRLSDSALVRERFTRVAPDEVLYQFEVQDPAFYTQTWRGELSFSPAPGPAFEYACHEGNYALGGILAGARLKEKQAAAVAR